MRFNRLVGLAAAVLCLLATTTYAPMKAGAQIADSAVTQIELTEEMVKAYIEAQRDLEGVIFRLPEDRAEMPDVKSRAQVEAILRRHNFNSLDDYNRVAGNIALVLEGVDPRTRTYVGAATVLRRQLAALQADPSATSDEKEAGAAELNAALRVTVAVKFPGNVDLVLKNLDAIVAHSPFGGAHED